MASTSRRLRASAQSPADDSELHTGRLGSWDLDWRIARGALCDVYAARAAGSRLDQPADYVLKLLNETNQLDPRSRQFLRREWQVAQRVHDPHLVPVLAAELETPPNYLVMPRIEGCSLATQLAEGGPLDLPMVCWIARQTAEGLEALERGGWMHGDVKPSNVLVSPSGHVTLIDLGFAAEVSRATSIVDRPLLGTISYMAPELLYSSTGGGVPSDVYSLGVMLFEMFTGRLPFDSDDVAELASQHRQRLPGDVRSYVPQIPVRAARLVQQMLAKEPLRRPSPGEVVQRLIGLEIETFAERYACEAA